MQKKGTVKNILLIQGAIFFLSFSAVFSKFAAQHPFFSLPYILYYGASIGVLGLYALIWQQILRRTPLTTAYGNRAVSMCWSVLWGVVFFNEVLTWKMVLGAAVILVGTIIVVTADE